MAIKLKWKDLIKRLHNAAHMCYIRIPKCIFILSAKWQFRANQLDRDFASWNLEFPEAENVLNAFFSRFRGCHWVENSYVLYNIINKHKASLDCKLIERHQLCQSRSLDRAFVYGKSNVQLQYHGHTSKNCSCPKLYRTLKVKLNQKCK